MHNANQSDLQPINKNETNEEKKIITSGKLNIYMQPTGYLQKW